MSGRERTVRWERLALLRTPVLMILGLAALCVAAFLWTAPAGWAMVGVSLIFVAYVTDSADSGQEVRR